MALENKSKTYEIEQVEERVVLVGVSERDGDDAEDSLVELAELVKTAGIKTNLISDIWNPQNETRTNNQESPSN